MYIYICVCVDICLNKAPTHAQNALNPQCFPRNKLLNFACFLQGRSLREGPGSLTGMGPFTEKDDEDATGRLG